MEFDEHYYETYYQHYQRQNPPYKLNFYHKIVRKYSPNAKTLLDAGCAYGAFLTLVVGNYKLLGSDISRHAISLARQQLPAVHFKVGSVETTSFNTKIDVITLFDVIEHVPNLKKTFATINMQLTEDGVVIFVIPVYDGITGKIVNLLDKDPSHIHKFSRDKWLKLIGSTFQILDYQGIFRYLLLGKYYLHFPTKLFRSLAPAII